MFPAEVGSIFRLHCTLRSIIQNIIPKYGVTKLIPNKYAIDHSEESHTPIYNTLRNSKAS